MSPETILVTATAVQMCGGDGLADVVGRRWGSGNKIPYNPDKSVAGSAALVGGGTVFSAALLAYLQALGYINLDLGACVPALAAVGVGAAVVESVPWKVDDNVTVPGVAWLLATLLLPPVAAAAAAVMGRL